MSVPYSVIYCDTCEARWTSTCLWGTFKYRLSDGRELDANRDLGWCAACSAIRPIESLPLIDDVRERLAASQSEIEELHSGVFGRLRTVLSAERRRKKSELMARFTDARDWLALLDARTEPIKCMICGSVDVAQIRPPFRTSSGSGSYDFATENEHPGCGGVLRVRDSGGSRLAIALPYRIYDGNGNLSGEGLDRG